MDLEDRNNSASTTSIIDPDTAVLGAAYLIVGLAVIVTNGVVVLVIVTTHDLHLPTLWLIAIMAWNDFCIGCLLLLFHAPSAFLGRYAYPESVMRVSFYLRLYLPGQTCLNIAMVILDRYIAVGRPLLYSKIVTTKRIIIAVIGSVIAGLGRFGFLRMSAEDLTFNVQLAVVTPTKNYQSHEQVLRTFGVVCVPVASFIIIVLCFCGIFRHMRHRYRATFQIGADEDVTKFPLMAITSVGVFCLAYIPFIIGVVLFMTNTKGYVMTVVLRCGLLAVYSVSFWNVFIYTATYRPFKEALLRLFCYSNYRRERQIEIERAFTAASCGLGISHGI